MDGGEEDGVSTGGGEGREEKCDMKTPTHHGGCKTQMSSPLHSYSLPHTLTQYPQTYSHCTHLPPTWTVKFQL